MAKRSNWNSNILPIQIRDDLIVMIAGIPHDLTEKEAKRIAAVVMAHAAKK